MLQNSEAHLKMMQHCTKFLKSVQPPLENFAKILRILGPENVFVVNVQYIGSILHFNFY